MTHAADLVFDPTLAVRSVRSYTGCCAPLLALSGGINPWTDLHLSRTMLPGALAGLRGSLRLRLASTFNHRPDVIILSYYTSKTEILQVIRQIFSRFPVYFVAKFFRGVSALAELRED